MFGMKTVLIMCVLFFLAMGVSVAKDNGLVLFLPFDEGHGTVAKDESDNGNDGIINGGVKWIKGQSGQALEFGGDTTEYVEVKDSESLHFDDKPFTYMAWIKPYQLNVPAFQLIISKRVPLAGDGKETASLFIKKDTDYLFVEFRDNIQGMFAVDVDKAVLTENEWNHVAWVKDNAELRFYVNGELKQTVEHDRVGTVNGTQPLYIGVHRYGDTWNSPFVGIIDNVAVFRSALTDAQVRQMMESVLPVQPLNSVASTWAQLKSGL